MTKNEGFHNLKPELFILSDEIITSLTNEEVDATFNDMQELGLAMLPYYNLAVQITGKAWTILAVTSASREDADYKEYPPRQPLTFKFALRSLDLNDLIDAQYSVNYLGDDMHTMLNSKYYEELRGKEMVQKYRDTLHWTSGQLLRMLVVVLATKNVVKDVKVNKLARLGIGLKKNPYHRTTTLTIGKVTEHTDGGTGEPTGEHRRPHLRRGHKRNQRYGPGLQFSREIFVPPVFVNADLGWIAERTAYNVNIRKGKS